MPTLAKEMAPLQEQLEQKRRLRAATHLHCVVCGADNARGLQVDFRPMADGGVQAHFDCAHIFEGYSHRIHGGVIAALLDGAMSNCLFAHGHVAVTAEATRVPDTLQDRPCHWPVERISYTLLSRDSAGRCLRRLPWVRVGIGESILDHCRHLLLPTHL